MYHVALKQQCSDWMLKHTQALNNCLMLLARPQNSQPPYLLQTLAMINCNLSDNAWQSQASYPSLSLLTLASHSLPYFILYTLAAVDPQFSRKRRWPKWRVLCGSRWRRVPQQEVILRKPHWLWALKHESTCRCVAAQQFCGSLSHQCSPSVACWVIDRYTHDHLPSYSTQRLHKVNKSQDINTKLVHGKKVSVSPMNQGRIRQVSDYNQRNLLHTQLQGSEI